MFVGSHINVKSESCHTTKLYYNLGQHPKDLGNAHVSWDFDFVLAPSQHSVNFTDNVVASQVKTKHNPRACYASLTLRSSRQLKEKICLEKCLRK